jgi:putative toxin-antitoxin system antitoxin component (TIGR02293 family)
MPIPNNVQTRNSMNLFESRNGGCGMSVLPSRKTSTTGPLKAPPSFAMLKTKSAPTRRREETLMAITGTAQQTKLDKIMQIAVEAFDDKEKAERWLHDPNLQLGNRLPIELIGTTEGFDAVKTVLYQIQYAVIG